ncbi:hypothetical protein Poli38472_006913 [Pythium oligandrum]|uniref:Uncharacterized protein n=1 Tax=Pythium oligandrum TaxID=41045 RepID=A0A8K1FHG9_PYTOL|nr:hypothetical protein Poli38472_006913 [Pythium oligandrum]|eukprot:TMW58768.1 hypothetical protein Poli38472_006913 [Pythium oligandrum]
MRDTLEACTRVSLPDPERCVYPSKYCPNPRATKLNGDRHKFCEFHRLKANKNQRRWQQRRRKLRDVPHSSPSPTAPMQTSTLPSPLLSAFPSSSVPYSPDDVAHRAAYMLPPPPRADENTSPHSLRPVLPLPSEWTYKHKAESTFYSGLSLLAQRSAEIMEQESGGRVLPPLLAVSHHQKLPEAWHTPLPPLPRPNLQSVNTQE